MAEEIKKTLLVKCPHCKRFIDLGNRYYQSYNSSELRFEFSRNCEYCLGRFTEKDTHEADYREVQQ